MRVYVSGRYSGKDSFEITHHITAARKVAIELWNMGHWAFCPHLNTAHFEEDCEAQYDTYIKGDLAFIDNVEAMVMVPGWEDSKGANLERDYALSLEMPVYYYPDLPPLHPTELKSPIQVAAFRRETGIMMRTHMSKNADYSPLNVGGPGMVGIVTRIWDKVTRIMNLVGFDIIIEKIDDDGTWHVTIKPDFKPKTPKHESLLDTFKDLPVYGIIAKLFLNNEWGH